MDELQKLQQFCINGEFLTFPSNLWWRNLWERTRIVDIVETFDLICNAEAWEDWINSDNPIGQGDRSFYEEVKQLTTIGVVAKRNDIDCFLL